MVNQEENMNKELCSAQTTGKSPKVIGLVEATGIGGQ